MRRTKTHIFTQTSEVEKSLEMGIQEKNVGFLLEILRNTMYKNPIAALCREVSCNARDAHREVGTPELPIEITLPTALDPHLKIQDFGPGINPQRVEKVFIWFGSTTKGHDNHQTGGFGLGSKTPFAYGDSFFVEVVHQEKRRHYIAYIDESNKGKFDLMNTESAEGVPNGTTVNIPVKESDFNHFATAIVQSTKHWKVRPILKGRQWEYPEESTLFMAGDDGDWELYEHKEHYYGNKCKVLIDCIEYEVNGNDLSGLINIDDKLHDKIIALLRKDLRLHFNTGKVHLPASRDSIRFDDFTVKNIIKRLIKVAKELDDSAQKKIETLGNIVEAELFLHKLNEHAPISMENKVWQGIKLQGITRSQRLDELVKHGLTAKDISITSYKMKKNRNDNYDLKVSRDENRILLTKEIFINGTGKRISRAVIKDYLGTDTNKLAQVFTFNTPEGRKFWMNEKHLQHIPWVLLSSLPKAPIKTRSSRGRMAVTGWLFDKCYTGHYKDVPWQPVENIDFADGYGVYVIAGDMRSGDIDAGENVPAYHMNIIQNLIGDNIYAIRKKDLNKLGDGWKTVKSLLELKMKEKLSGFDVNEAKNLSRCDKYMASLSSTVNKIDKDLLIEGALLNWIEASNDIEKRLSLSDGKRQLYNMFSILASPYVNKNSTASDGLKTALKNHCENVKETYPLLDSINHHVVSTRSLLEYIALIDERNLREKEVEVEVEESIVAVA